MICGENMAASVVDAKTNAAVANNAFDDIINSFHFHSEEFLF